LTILDLFFLQTILSRHFIYANVAGENAEQPAKKEREPYQMQYGSRFQPVVVIF